MISVYAVHPLSIQIHPFILNVYTGSLDVPVAAEHLKGRSLSAHET